MRALGDYMFVRYRYPSKSGKTKIFVVTDRHGGVLGEIKWFGRWRCYAFFPEIETIYNASCMTELAKFCDEQTKEHRNK